MEIKIFQHNTFYYADLQGAQKDMKGYKLHHSITLLKQMYWVKWMNLRSTSSYKSEGVMFLKKDNKWQLRKA